MKNEKGLIRREERKPSGSQRRCSSSLHSPERHKFVSFHWEKWDWTEWKWKFRGQFAKWKISCWIEQNSQVKTLFYTFWWKFLMFLITFTSLFISLFTQTDITRWRRWKMETLKIWEFSEFTWENWKLGKFSLQDRRLSLFEFLSFLTFVLINWIFQLNLSSSRGIFRVSVTKLICRWNIRNSKVKIILWAFQMKWKIFKAHLTFASFLDSTFDFCVRFRTI